MAADLYRAWRWGGPLHHLLDRALVGMNVHQHGIDHRVPSRCKVAFTSMGDGR